MTGRGKVLSLWSLFTVEASAGVSTGCEPRDQTPVGRGARILQRSCAGCHGPDGRGSVRLGLGLAKPSRDLTDPEFHAHVTDAQLRAVIRTGKGLMPAFGGLMGDEDLTNVIAFIRTLPPGARAPQPSATPPSALVVPPQAPDKDGVLQ